jgi:hypothetical protein
VLGYVVGLLDAVPMLRKLITRRTAEAIELSNHITIEVHTASFRTVRGFTVVAAICDEIAFWRSEDSANPDYDIVNALKPAMLTVPEPLLLGLSSPYARKGVLWDAHHRHFDDSRLVSQLLSLERRTGASGKDAIDHPRGLLDDLANAVAGALVLASRGGDEMFSDYAERVERERLARERAEEEGQPICPTCHDSGFFTVVDGKRRCLRCDPIGPTIRDLRNFLGSQWW